MHIFPELEVFMCLIRYETARKWRKQYQTCSESVKDAAKFDGRPVTARDIYK